MITSSSNWTTIESLDQLALTQLPAWSDIAAGLKLAIPQPPAYGVKSVDTFSPKFGIDGVGTLNIVPFSELNNVIQNGDVVVFMEHELEFTNEKAMKQRGWHAEIAFRNPNGIAVQCAPYGEECEIEECACIELSNNRHFGQPLRNNLHIFRIAESSGEDGQIRGLLEGVRLWRHVYHHYNFPPVDKAWFLDPADFGTVEELETIAKNLILSPNDAPTMYCMQWVHAVLSLALNFPLNRTTLERLGVLEAYEHGWPALGFVSDAVKPLNQLPIIPYTPKDYVKELCQFYLEMSADEMNSAMPVIFMSEPIQTFLLNVPTRSVPPIVPFLEYRQPTHTGTVAWEYVATTFPNDRCKPKPNDVQM
jgi:hypothetical protein